VHLPGGTFEDPAAAAGEEGVADERVPGAEVGHVAGGVAGDVDHVEPKIELRDNDRVTAHHRVVDRRDLFPPRPEDRCRVLMEDLADTADVVLVVVGEEDRRDLHAAIREDSEDRLGLAGIDDRHGLGV